MGHGSKLIKNSFFILFNTVFMMFTSWIISIWIARQLGPVNYGIFNLVLWISGTMTWVLGMGLIHAITKFVASTTGGARQEPSTYNLLCPKNRDCHYCNHHSGSCVFPFKNRRFSSLGGIVPVFSCCLGLLPGMVTAILSAAIGYSEI